MKREKRIVRFASSSALATVLLTTAFSARSGFAWTSMNIPGNWDGFNAGDTAGPFLMNKVSPPGTPAGMDWYTNVMYVAASLGDVTNGTYQFKLAANGSFGTNWGGGATVLIDNT